MRSPDYSLETTLRLLSLQSEELCVYCLDLNTLHAALHIESMLMQALASNSIYAARLAH